MGTEKPTWEPPQHLLPYAPHTSYPDRAAELFNSDATPFNNTPLFVMHVETRAQWEILERLHASGQLRPTPPAQPVRGHVSFKKACAVLALLVLGLLNASLLYNLVGYETFGWIAVTATALSGAGCLAGLLILARRKNHPRSAATTNPQREQAR